MKKRKLKNIDAHFDCLPSVNSSIPFNALAETLSAHLYELYRGTVVFSCAEDRAITHVSCDAARLFVCLRLLLDCADENHPIRVHLSLDEEHSAALTVCMQRERELPEKELRMIAMLGHLRLRINDEGAHLGMEAKREKVLHLFALDIASLDQIFNKINRMFEEIPNKV